MNFISVKTITALFAAAVVFAVCPCATARAQTRQAIAQQQPQRNFSFFDFLFQRSQPERQLQPLHPQRYAPPPGQRARAQSNGQQNSERPAEPTRPPRLGLEAERPNATLKLAILGDEWGEWLAYGLTQASMEKSDIAYLDRSRTFAGILRTDASEFVKLSTEALAKDQSPDGLIVLVGLADRGIAIKRDKDSFEPFTDGWRAGFSERIAAIAQGLKARGLPVIWVGLPPVKGTKSMADYAAMNQMIRTEAEKHGIPFIDIWNGFVDDNQLYAASGPDVSGQIKRLRHGNGVYFTPSGGKKLGFFVEQEVRRLFAARLNPTPFAGSPPQRVTMPDNLGVPVPDTSPPDLAKSGLIAKPLKPAIGPSMVLTTFGGLPSSAQPESLTHSAPKAEARPPSASFGKGHAMDFQWKPKQVQPN